MRTNLAMTPSRWTASLIALATLALTLRLPGALHGGLWRDEAECVAIAGLPTWSDMLSFLRSSESHPPGFYVLLRLWLALGLSGDRVLVALSVACGAAHVPVAMTLVRRHASEIAALSAGILVAVSGPLVRYSDQVRPYSLLPLLGLICADLLLRLLGPSPRRWMWPAFVAANAGMLYTHNWSALFWAGEALVTGVTLSLRSERRAFSDLRPWLLTHGAVLLLWLPWLPTVRVQSLHAGHGARALDATLPGKALALLGVAGLAAWGQVLALGLLATAASAIAVTVGRHGLRKHPAIGALLGIPLFTYSGVFVLGPISDLGPGRCNLPSRLLVLIGLTALATLLARDRRRLLAAVAASGALAAAAPWSLPGALATSRSNARELMATLTLRLTPMDLVLVAPSTIAPVVDRYLSPRFPSRTYPNLPRASVASYADVAGRDRDPSGYAAALALVREARSSGRTVVLITHSDNAVGSPPPEVVAIPDQPTPWHYGQWRAQQLARYLTELYGAPTPLDAPCAPGQDECLTALRFSAR